MQPRIAIPYPHTDVEFSSRTLPDYERAVRLAGGEPIIVPASASPAEAAQVVKTCDGVLLPGSPADVDPQKYGEPREPRTANADPVRDMVDELLLQDAHAMRKPILGVCYGLQSLNVWRSGTLVQHIESAVQHQRPAGAAPGTVVRHAAVVQAGSRLGAIVAPGKPAGRELSITVNSFHHQSVARPGDGLRVVARSPQDGILEALEGTSPEHFVVGVQWHPERSYDEDHASRAIFAALIEAAREWHERMLQGTGDFETAIDKS